MGSRVGWGGGGRAGAQETSPCYLSPQLFLLGFGSRPSGVYLGKRPNLGENPKGWGRKKLERRAREAPAPPWRGKSSGQGSGGAGAVQPAQSQGPPAAAGRGAAPRSSRQNQDAPVQTFPGLLMPASPSPPLRLWAGHTPLTSAHSLRMGGGGGRTTLKGLCWLKKW